MEPRSDLPIPGEAKPAVSSTGLAEKRTSFAGQRVQLALERTTLAWVRTSLAMVSFGLGVIGFYRSLRQQAQTPEAIHMHEAAIQFGYGLLILGIAATALCGIAHWRALLKLERGDLPGVSMWPLSITLAALLTLLGLWVLWSLLVK